VIAVDTSSLVAYLSGDVGADVEAIALALDHRQAALPPVVLSELLSDPQLPSSITDLFLGLPLLELMGGYWERAGLLCARLRSRGRKARLADTLVAQSCLDHDVVLITRDGDFRHFERAVGLRLFGTASGR
jgi:predicted nucleic acid-binding protein